LQGTLVVNLTTEMRDGSYVFIPLIHSTNITGRFDSVFLNAASSPQCYDVQQQVVKLNFGILVNFNLGLCASHGNGFQEALIPPWLIVLICVVPVVFVIIFVICMMRWKNKLGTAIAVRVASWNLKQIEHDQHAEEVDLEKHHPKIPVNPLGSGAM